MVHQMLETDCIWSQAEFPHNVRYPQTPTGGQAQRLLRIPSSIDPLEWPMASRLTRPPGFLLRQRPRAKPQYAEICRRYACLWCFIVESNRGISEPNKTLHTACYTAVIWSGRLKDKFTIFMHLNLLSFLEHSCFWWEDRHSCRLCCIVLVSVWSFVFSNILCCLFLSLHCFNFIKYIQ